MAEEERLTKRERRERAREERRRKEAEEAKRTQRQRLTSILVTALIVVGVGAVVWSAVSGDEEGAIDDAILVSSSEVEEARSAAGCEVVADAPFPDSGHHDPASAPPADALYTGVRPTHSGPHFSGVHPVVSFSGDQLEERALTHNLEHGAVIAWFDPEQVDGGTMDDIGAWAERLNNSGFDSRGGAAVFSAAYEDPGITSGKAIAFRAWGYALDCDTWDETVANGFVIDRYGTHGAAPERNFAPYPEQVLRYGDRDVEDNTEAPTDDGHEDASPSEGEATPAETTSPTESPSPTESASE